MKRRMLVLMMVLTLALSTLVGCQSAAESTEATGLEDIRVAFVLNSTATDGNWGQANYESAMCTIEALGLTEDQYVILEQIDAYSADTESILEMLATDGYNVIFGCSSGYNDAMLTVAERHSDVYFACSEGASTVDNMVAYSIDDTGTIFLCGYATALMSTQDAMGFVGCQPVPSVIRGVNAFAAGARYANADATVKVLWSNSWYDPAKEKEATNTLISEGIDVIGYHAGSTAVAAACEEAGTYTNGMNVAMEDAGPNSVVTSGVWLWEPVFTEIIEMVQTGTWSNDTIYMGIAEGACDISTFNENILSAEQIAQCNEVRDLLISGELPVFETPVYDNQGNLMLEDGSFSMEDYLNMNFYLDNVIGDLS